MRELITEQVEDGMRHGKQDSRSDGRPAKNPCESDY